MIRLNDYTLSDKIHASKSAEIYRGSRNSDGTPVVAKLLRGEYPSELAFARHRHEHRLLAKSAGPGGVRSLGLERVGNGLALLLTDEGATSLAQLLESPERSLRRLLQAAVAAARVVRDVHQKGVVHKAIEPHHLIVDANDGDRTRAEPQWAQRRVQTQSRALPSHPSAMTDCQGQIARPPPKSRFARSSSRSGRARTIFAGAWSKRCRRSRGPLATLLSWQRRRCLKMPSSTENHCHMRDGLTSP
jgi:serine/threonine protein kinase